MFRGGCCTAGGSRRSAPSRAARFTAQHVKSLARGGPWRTSVWSDVIDEENGLLAAEEQAATAGEGIQIDAEQGLVVGGLPQLGARRPVPEDQMVGRMDGEEEGGGVARPLRPPVQPGQVADGQVAIAQQLQGLALQERKSAVVGTAVLTYFSNVEKIFIM